MTHPVFESELDAYLDGELAADEARELEAHLAHCQECVRFRDERLELRAALAARMPAFQAPDALRKRIQTAAASAARPGRATRRFTIGSWSSLLALAASLVIVAGGTWRLARENAARDTLVAEVLESHVRSLMPGHLTDVVSSDQHTVKPWFNGKLDYSPPVYDFAGRGYPLLGGRLDYVGGRSVAVLVYGRRQHLINVFLWPTTSGPSGGLPSETQQGYHVLHFVTPDYTYWVVSDLGLPELQEFAGLLRSGDSAANARR